ncbi:RipA family octameric membrane protein [Streptomyces huasconensis]|uniref:RipA family octameric membrane protein n=1 Tax=Streptomyces huasconensis TaxID=1854574 RepID=UPI0033F26C58
MASSDPHKRAEVLELYKLAVDMADRISARRGSANAFFLSVQTTFIALISLGFPRVSGAPWWVPPPSLSLAGTALSAAWWMQLRSYRDLNTAKFACIIKLEERFPVKIFADEWEELRRDRVHGWRTSKRPANGPS